MRKIALFFAIMAGLWADAYTTDDFVWDFEWLEPNNSVTVGVGESHQLQYTTSTNYSWVFLATMADSWIHYDF